MRDSVTPNGMNFHTELCLIEFDKASGDLNIEPFPKDIGGALVASEIKLNFIKQLDTHDDYGLRELVRNVLMSIRAVNLRPKQGGLYFVASEHEERLIGLRLLADLIPEVDLHTAPLLDTPPQRAMLASAVEGEVSVAVSEILDEIEGLVQARKDVTSARLARYASKLDDLRTLTKETNALLDTNLTDAKVAVTALQNRLMGVMAMEPKKGRK
jgi:hypothetical protein